MTSNSNGKRAGKTTKKTGKPARRRSKAALKKSTPAFDGPDRVHAFADSVAEDDTEAVEQVERHLETWIVVRLAGESFAMPVAAVREILRVESITRVPHAPYPVQGIINMRGRVLPVVNLRIRIGLPDAPLSPSSRIVITSSQGRLFGLLVDAVQSVIQLDRHAIASPPPDVMTSQSEYITGVYHRNDELLILLDVDRVLLISESSQNASPAIAR